MERHGVGALRAGMIDYPTHAVPTELGQTRDRLAINMALLTELLGWHTLGLPLKTAKNHRFHESRFPFYP
jgi:hypothetical protein